MVFTHKEKIITIPDFLVFKMDSSSHFAKANDLVWHFVGIIVIKKNVGELFNAHCMDYDAHPQTYA